MISWPVIPASYPSSGITSIDNKRFFVDRAGFYLVTWTVQFDATGPGCDFVSYLMVNNETNIQFGTVNCGVLFRTVCLSSSVTVYLEKDDCISIIALYTALNDFVADLRVPSFQGNDSQYSMQLAIVMQA